MPAKKTINKYKGIYDVGWDKIRQKRFQRLKDLGLINRDLPEVSSDEALEPWDKTEHKEWQAHRMQVFAAMVEEMDSGVGVIVEALRANNQLENTLVIFLSDNGGSCEGHLYNTIERTGAPWESKIIPQTTPNGEKVRPGDWPDFNLGPANTFGSYGLNWASVSNTPFKRHKSWVHEGGISTPCIMHWPQGIKKTNQIVPDMAHIMDFMPTFVELSHKPYPEKFHGETITPMAGKSLLSLLHGKNFGHEYLCWEHEGNRAIHMGKWKLVSEYPGTWKTFYSYPNKGQWELYNIQDDRIESENLSHKYPQKCQQMENLFNDWAKSSGVKPWEQIENILF